MTSEEKQQWAGTVCRNCGRHIWFSRVDRFWLHDTGKQEEACALARPVDAGVIAVYGEKPEGVGEGRGEILRRVASQLMRAIQ